MRSVYEDMNPDWANGLMDQPEWEPWVDDEGPELDDTIGGCAYCGAPDVRERPEPFGQQPCCEECFDLLIGGET